MSEKKCRKIIFIKSMEVWGISVGKISTSEKMMVLVTLTIFGLCSGATMRMNRPPVTESPCSSYCECPRGNIVCKVSAQFLDITTDGVPWNVNVLYIRTLPQYFATLNITGNLERMTDLRQLSITNGALSHMPLLPKLPSLTYLDLSHNFLTHFPSDALRNNPQITHLNLSNNALSNITTDSLQRLRVLKVLDISHNPKLRQLSENIFAHTDHLEFLSLSYTGIASLPSSWADHFHSLRHLNVSHNTINSFRGISLPVLNVLDLSFNPLRALPPLQNFPNLRHMIASHTFVSYLKFSEIRGCHLHVLDLSSSKITNLNEDLLSECKALEELDLSSNHDLWRVEHGALNGLQSLHILRINNCPNLIELEDDVFNGLTGLNELHLQNSEVKVLPYSLRTLKNLTILNLDGTSILCDCHAHWFSELLPILTNLAHSDSAETKIQCVDGIQRSPQELTALVASLECSLVETISKSNTWILTPWGENAILECNVTGNPEPEIIWQTVDQRLHIHHKYVPSSIWLPNQISEALRAAVSQTDGKFMVLASGDLLVRNVTRNDIGRYKCFAFNPVSNSSLVTFIGLDDQQFRDFVIESILVGSACAAAFLFITLLVQFIKYVMMRLGWMCCCCEKRLVKKAKQIRHLIETIEGYRSTQLERLRDNYNSQVVSIKDGCNQQMEKVRESYSQQSRNIKDLCDFSSQQITGARDQYVDQVNKIREYSSSQMSRVRENYVFQRNRIRKFSGHQMLRIRETYKYQQKTLGKLLENLPDLYIQTCRTGSCQRTDSVIFDDDMEGLDVYYKTDFLLDDQSFGSDYYTPNSTLTRKSKRFLKHSRNASATSNTTEYHDATFAWLTPRGSITSDDTLPPHKQVSGFVPITEVRLNELKMGKHRRCYSVSGGAPLIQLFHPKSVVIEEMDTSNYPTQSPGKIAKAPPLINTGEACTIKLETEDSEISSNQSDQKSNPAETINETKGTSQQTSTLQPHSDKNKESEVSVSYETPL